MKKKCAFLLISLNSGGVENYLLRFLKYYEKEIDATIYCKAGFIGDLEEEYEKIGAQIKKFKLGYFAIGQFLKLKREFETNKYDSVCDFTGNFAALPLLMAKRANISKRIACYRGSENRFNESTGRLFYNKILNKIIPNVATSILANSKSAFDFFHPNIWQNNKKFEVIYNGIDAMKFKSTNDDLREELSIPKSAFVIGHVGRHNEAKNHKTIIKVALKVCEENKDVFFILCGKNVPENIQPYLKNNDLKKQIILLDFRRDIINVLNTLDCFYFPSITEGQPNALIESMICGIPFVASNIAPILECVPATLNKQLIPPLNEDLAINKILELKEKKTSFSNTELSNWAIEFFKPSLRFRQFYQRL